jgi:hypothetical protein
VEGWQSRGSRCLRGIKDLSQELYVDPRTGLLRINKHYRSWRQRNRADARANAAETNARRRIIDDVTQLHLIDGEWYEIRFAPLPAGERDAERAKPYGVRPTGAVAKRQLSHREKKSYGLL